MKLYSYWRSSSAWRVRIALAYKNIPHELVYVHLLRNGGEQYHTEFTKKNPSQQVPLLELDGEPARFISQSLAIIEYLEELRPTPSLLPGALTDRAQARRLAETINSGIQPFQNLRLLKQLSECGADFNQQDWLERTVGNGLAALEASAAPNAGKFLVGDLLSLADVCLVPQLYACRRLGVGVEGYPTLLAAERACLELDAFALTHPSQEKDHES